jgi:hypothetical protein
MTRIVEQGSTYCYFLKRTLHDFYKKMQKQLQSGEEARHLKILAGQDMAAMNGFRGDLYKNDFFTNAF